MRAKFGVVVLGAWIATVAQAAGPKIREVQVQFPKGETGATLKGKLKGDETVDYKVWATAGQSMGNRYEGPLPADGTCTIRVYLMGNAARRNESASYSLDVGVSGGAKKAEAGPAAGQPPAKVDWPGHDRPLLGAPRLQRQALGNVRPRRQALRSPTGRLPGEADSGVVRRGPLRERQVCGNVAGDAGGFAPARHG
jgi:hypothetical protein